MLELDASDKVVILLKEDKKERLIWDKSQDAITTLVA